MTISLCFATPIWVHAEEVALRDVNDRIEIGIIGDVMAQGLSQAIKRQLEGQDNPIFQVYNFAKGSSGLVRDDYYDWNVELPPILDGQKFDYMLIFMGSNDRQSISIKGKNYKAKTPKWREEYIHRIDQLLDGVKARNVKTIWLGQPISRSKSFATDMALFNEIYRQHVESHDGVFFDVWSLFADEDGKFSRSGADVNGQIKSLRASNGIHFTRTGYDKLAFQILELIQNLENGDVRPDFLDQGELVDAEKYDLSQNLGADAIIVQRRDDNGIVKQPQQNVANTVFGDDDTTLTDTNKPSTSEFLGEIDESLPLWKSVLGNGYIIVPEFGRADDFSWPRN